MSETNGKSVKKTVMVRDAMAHGCEEREDVAAFIFNKYETTIDLGMVGSYLHNERNKGKKSVPTPTVSLVEQARDLEKLREFVRTVGHEAILESFRIVGEAENFVNKYGRNALIDFVSASNQDA